MGGGVAEGEVGKCVGGAGWGLGRGRERGELGRGSGLGGWRLQGRAETRSRARCSGPARPRSQSLLMKAGAGDR
jgi:hypothetical protein